MLNGLLSRLKYVLVLLRFELIAISLRGLWLKTEGNPVLQSFSPEACVWPEAALP